MKKILVLLVSPQDKDTPSLELGRELQQVETALERAINSNQFEILIRWAAQVRDLRRELLHEKPQIVHFSGHGAGTSGLVLETDSRQKQFVSTEALAGLFELCKEYVECVLLNACYSETQAIAIHRHIDYVIGMNQAILDSAAIEFASGFYDALAAGCSYKDAYKVGCNAIDLQGLKDSTGKLEAVIPVLKERRRGAGVSVSGASDSPDPKRVESLNSTEDSALSESSVPKKERSQSVSIRNSSVSGQFNIGDEATLIQQVNQGNAAKQLATAEVVELIDRIEAIIRNSTLPDNQKHTATTHLEVAKEAAKEEKPDKDYAAKSLQKATKILKEGYETVEAGQGLWHRVEPILTQLLPWLGTASHFLGF